jgi:DNA-directed RNA polymerase subunit RPC12/RpoP
VAYAVAIFFCGLSAGIIGKLKGSSFWIWFAVGLVLPVIGSVAAALYRNERNEPRRACPECGKVQPLYVQVCTRCGRDLEWPEELIPAR